MSRILLLGIPYEVRVTGDDKVLPSGYTNASDRLAVHHILIFVLSVLSHLHPGHITGGHSK